MCVRRYSDSTIFQVDFWNCCDSVVFLVFHFILEILLYYSTHVLGFLENATTQYKHGPYMGEGAKIWFLFSSLIHNSILRGQYQLFLKTFILFGFQFGRTLWRLFQKRVACSELDIYVFSWNIQQYCMS